MPRKDFVNTLRSIAARHNLEFEAWSHDWIIQISDASSGKRCSIFGYTFDANGAGAAEICREKSATSLVLEKHGVANTPHHVFLNPAAALAADYVPTRGNWEAIRKLIDDLGFPVVLKPLKGTGGLGVVKARCWRDVEAAVQNIFTKDYGLAISPYKKIKDEYRCFCIYGVIEFIYRKVRSEVVGDGVSSVSALILRRIGSAANEKEAYELTKAAGEVPAEEWARVPSEGEAVPLQWKHNLGQGASVDTNISPEKTRALEAVALAAARAVGTQFCSADVIEVESEGFMIMEINGGVMMDSLIGQLGEEGVALASRIYEKAVLGSLDLQQPSAKRQKTAGTVA